MWTRIKAAWLKKYPTLWVWVSKELNPFNYDLRDWIVIGVLTLVWLVLYHYFG